MQDDGGTSDGGQNQDQTPNTLTFNVIGPPAVGNAGGIVGYTEQAAPVTIDSDLTVSSANNLTAAAIWIASGFVDGDVLAFTPQSGIAGAFDSNTHVLTLSGSATAAAYQDVLRSVTFASSSDNPDSYGSSPSRTI